MLKTLSLDAILGFHTDKISEGGSAFFIRLDQDGMEKAFEYWESQSGYSRPKLRGICASPTEESRVFFNLLLELPTEPKVFCVEVDMPRGKPIKNFSLLWPYANCWMTELEDFSGYVFERSDRDEGVQWRRN